MVKDGGKWMNDEWVCGLCGSLFNLLVGLLTKVNSKAEGKET